MADTAGILRELHRLRRQVKNLQEEIDRLPRQLKAQQAKVVRQEESKHQGDEKVKKLQLVAREKEGKLKDQHLQIAKYEQQLKTATSKKEYDALQVEIAYAKQSCRKIEDEILAALGEVEEMSATLPELEKAVQQARGEVVQFEKNSQGRQANLTEQLQQAAQQLKEVELQLPVEIRPLYDRQVSARGEDAMSAVQKRTCTACYTGITAQNYNELLQGMWVVCKSCGRILYLPEPVASEPPAAK